MHLSSVTATYHSAILQLHRIRKLILPRLIHDWSLLPTDHSSYRSEQSTPSKHTFISYIKTFISSGCTAYSSAVSLFPTMKSYYRAEKNVIPAGCESNSDELMQDVLLMRITHQFINTFVELSLTITVSHYNSVLFVLINM